MAARFWRAVRVGLTTTALAVIGLPFVAEQAHAWDVFFGTPTQAAEIDGTVANDRPWALAAGEFDATPGADIVVIRYGTDGALFFMHGNNNGTFAPPVKTSWRVGSGNAASMTAADFNGDGKLDIAWGATAVAAGGAMADGDVRVIYGNGDGTFQLTSYLYSGITFNLGTLAGSVGVDVGSMTSGDVNGDGRADIVAGGINGTNAVITLFANNGNGTFTKSTLLSETAGATVGDPVYYPPTVANAVVSPWGLALGDADGNGTLDLFVGDRALYVYLFRNNGSGVFTMQGNNGVISGRPNVYLAHESYRLSVGYTESLAAADLNGDGKADLALGLQLGGQTSQVTHDGEVLVDLSDGSGGYGLLGSVGDIGMIARGLALADVNADGAKDVVSGEYSGKVMLLKQLPPLDTDGDGISDYVDNAPNAANAPRLDLNTDGLRNYLDQLDNDYDTVLGSPENPSSWSRLGDVVDPDNDNDGVANAADNCPLTANADQSDVDGDGRGDACDPLDNRDPDGDGVPNGFAPGSPLYNLAKSAAAKWSTGTTHFVLRIDALGRWFQDEFTRVMTDAAVLSPADWAAKCWQDYDNGDVPGYPTYEPCGDDATKTLTLQGGKGVPISLATIPRLLWTDQQVVDWINDRNDSANLEIVQHGTYHVDNTPYSDWANDNQLNYYSCEICGLTVPENYEFLRIGKNTLLGNYGDPALVQSGATGASPKIDWSTSANPLISFAPPFDANDGNARDAISQLGFKGFSASFFEEQSPKFTPEGTHEDAFDQFGMFHASADTQLNPPDTTGDTYDPAAYNSYLNSKTTPGGLTTWLIEEVDWSGRPCNNVDRLTTTGCNGGPNRENDTVYQPRWDAWNQVLDFVKNYPGGVVMTIGEVALAKAFDNAPTVANPNQADSDHDGIGDVVDGGLTAQFSNVTRTQPGTLDATLANGLGQPMAGETLTFSFDADWDGTPETYTAVTGSDGTAHATVTATEAPSIFPFGVSWTGSLGQTASANGQVMVWDHPTVTWDPDTATSGTATNPVSVGATVVDSLGNPVPWRSVYFTIGDAFAEGVTDAAGHATATLTLGKSGDTTLTAEMPLSAPYFAAAASPVPFGVNADTTTLALDPLNPTSGAANDPVTFHATLTEPDGPVAGRTVTFTLGSLTASATTDGSGVAGVSLTPPAEGSYGLDATFAGDAFYTASSASGFYDVVRKGTVMTLYPANPVSAQTFDVVTVGTTLTNTDGAPIEGRQVQFTLGSQTGYGTTDSAGWASISLLVADDAGAYALTASFAGDNAYEPSSATQPFDIVSAPSFMVLDAGNPASGRMETPATFGATLYGPGGQLLAGRTVTFTLGTATAQGVTDGNGHASVTFTLPGPAGPATVEASWTGDTTYASSFASAPFTVLSATTALTLDGANPSSGQYTDSVTLGATLRDAAGTPLPGQSVRFTVDGFAVTGTTDPAGHVTVTGTLTSAPGAYTLTAAFAGTSDFLASSATHAFTVLKEDTAVQFPNVSAPSGNATLRARLVDADTPTAGIAGRTLRFYQYVPGKNRQGGSWKLLGSATTDANGWAVEVVLAKNVPTGTTAVKASFGSDKWFNASEGSGTLTK